MRSKPVVRWGLEWRSENRLDGKRRHLVMDNLMPALFTTRRAARAFRDKRYGYIAKAPDLRAEPHGWQLPRVVRVECRVKA
jgi:hypothetical protein